MGLTVYGGGGKPEEEKTVTAGTSVIEVLPSSGKVMKKVTVNPTPTESKEVTAGTEDTTVSPTDGKCLSGVTVHPTPSQKKTVIPTADGFKVSPETGKLLSAVFVDGDSDLVAGNIKQGVNIFGVDGSFDNSHGAYVWKKYTYLDIDVVSWAYGTDAQILAMVEAADQGLINLADYWSVGDARTVQLSAMSATGVGESHAAQEVDLVLMHAGGYDLNTAVASGRTKCSFVVGLKDCLAEAGYINSIASNNGSWNGSARRTWCNSVFKNAMPSTLLPIFKQFKTVTAQTFGGSTNQTSVDYFALPAEREICGARTNCNQTEYNALFQFDYYKTTSNRVKKLGKAGAGSVWWERSPCYAFSTYFCMVLDDGTVSSHDANINYGLAPFGCI